MIRKRDVLCGGAALVLAATLGYRALGADQTPRQLTPFADSSGNVQTVTTARTFDTTNPFFQSLGTNGRACVTCHQAGDGWTVTPAHIQQRFAATDGTDPIFRPSDGATCSSDDVSSVAARRQAYSLLLNKGLIRVALPMPATADFTLVSFEDPYGCISGAEFSMYRRVLPATNLKFLSTIMWDGREPSFTHQAMDATLGHAEAVVAPTDDQLQQIADFETALFTAQVSDRDAGKLTIAGANGGPAPLSQQNFFIGINDPLGGNPSGAPFDPNVFTIFAKWLTAGGDARRAVARGEALFNTRPIQITGVAGLNDKLGQPSISGTCSTCHDAPNAGNHSVAMALNIGTSDASRRTPDLPLYTFQCNATGEVIQTSDPGRALITGHCADIGKVKGPVLRGLAARPPYFHNGSAATLADVVDFYNQRFKLQLTDGEKADLIAFLRTL